MDDHELKCPSGEPLLSGGEPWRNGCIGPFYGNENDVYPCDAVECPTCQPRLARLVRESGEVTR